MTSSKVTAFFTGVILLLSLSATALAADELYGTWWLVSFKRTTVDTGETTDMFGKSPKGMITFGGDGRVISLVTSDQRPNVNVTKMTDQDRAELYKTMIAYAGTYTFDGKTLKIRVNVSWNESWNGIEQIRQARIEGNRLFISADPALGALDGKLRTSVFTWEKVQ
jgi:hypothetical protein